MDAVPVDSVIEASAECSDRARAEELLSASLAAARGPRRSSAEEARWRLTMTVVAASPGIKAADARILDDRGRLVAERTVSDRTSKSCVALARAVGAWAQIVLDDELVREHDEEAFREREAARRPAPEPRPIATTTTLDAPIDAGQEGAGEPRTAPARSFEVGTMLFLRNGAAATGGAFGVSPFVTVGIADKWVLRPSLMYGASTSRVPPDASNRENFSTVGGRLDVCRRMPGNYIESRGIEFDACVGGDATHVWSDRESVQRGSLGPSAVLRGELGYDFGLEIRSMVGVNLSRAPFMSEQELPPFVAAAELGASVRFR
ncbi:MAG: hypothetical protein KF782_25035 [Labilithrix sp.]|nr:hypothetical protein [Labilithrix sp.]